MTTIIPFTPSLAPGQPPFQFQATFDGSLYQCTVMWAPFGAYGQRWYIWIFDQNNRLVVVKPLVGSSNGSILSSLTWTPGTGRGGTVVAVAAAPHWFRLGAIIVLSISGASPSGYNVVTPVEVVDPVTFTYPLTSDPGPAITAGQYSYDVNLLAGYFSSTLIYRYLNGNLEITP